MKPERFIPITPAEFLKSRDIISGDSDQETISDSITEKKTETNALDEGIRLYQVKDWENALQAFLAVDKSNFSTNQRIELAYYLGLCYAKTKQYDEAVL